MRTDFVKDTRTPADNPLSESRNMPRQQFFFTKNYLITLMRYGEVDNNLQNLECRLLPSSGQLEEELF